MKNYFMDLTPPADECVAALSRTLSKSGNLRAQLFQGVATRTGFKLNYEQHQTPTEPGNLFAEYGKILHDWME